MDGGRGVALTWPATWQQSILFALMPQDSLRENAGSPVFILYFRFEKCLTACHHQIRS